MRWHFLSSYSSTRRVEIITYSQWYLEKYGRQACHSRNGCWIILDQPFRELGHAVAIAAERGRDSGQESALYASIVSDSGSFWGKKVHIVVILRVLPEISADGTESAYVMCAADPNNQMLGGTGTRSQVFEGGSVAQVLCKVLPPSLFRYLIFSEVHLACVNSRK